MRVRMTVHGPVADPSGETKKLLVKASHPGLVVDLSDDEAKRLIVAGQAEEASKPAAETQMAEAIREAEAETRRRLAKKTKAAPVKKAKKRS
jgi:hypothetical protein